MPKAVADAGAASFAASRLPPNLTAWVLTDGKAGDEIQCLGVARALGLVPQVRRVAPRPPFVYLMPRGPIDPREGPAQPGSPVAPPYPDLLIASGRRAIPYVRHVKRASGGRTFTVILKDPRVGAGAADLIWVPQHDPLRGGNVVVTLTSPHGIDEAALAAARTDPPAELAALPAPRAAVLVGGDSRHHHFTPDDIARFVERLSMLAGCGVSLMVTTSRRTPPALAEGVRRLVAMRGGYLWEGEGPNPYVAMLALADAVVATADSTNMLGEAAVTGRPLLVFRPSGGHRKVDALLKGLAEAGIAHDFAGRLEGSAYLPQNSTGVIADRISQALTVHRAALGLAGPR